MSWVRSPQWPLFLFHFFFHFAGFFPTFFSLILFSFIKTSSLCDFIIDHGIFEFRSYLVIIYMFSSCLLVIQEVMDEMFPAKRLKYVGMLWMQNFIFRQWGTAKTTNRIWMRWKGSNYFQIVYFLALILFLLMNTIVVPYVSGDKKGERFYDSTFHPDFVHQVIVLMRSSEGTRSLVSILHSVRPICWYACWHLFVDELVLLFIETQWYRNQESKYLYINIWFLIEYRARGHETNLRWLFAWGFYKQKGRFHPILSSIIQIFIDFIILL